MSEGTALITSHMIVESDWDTIAAISTPYGESGIGIVRVSGSGAREVAERLFRPIRQERSLESHRIYYGEILDPVNGGAIDEVLLLFMEKPRTYTREDIVEIHCHGGRLVLRKILECTLKAGARLAEPGEFTKRAFLNGRIDLAQAEAVIETIRAKTPGALRAANEQRRGRVSREVADLKNNLLSVLAEIEGRLDFPEEELGELAFDGICKDLESVSDRLEELVSSFEEGRVLREGFVVAIVGKTNVGKSSLLNALLGEERAIVTAVAGTTRDVVEEMVDLSGLMLCVVDTAGIGRWRNEAEQEGIRRTKRAIREAHLILLVVDRSRRLSPVDERIFRLVRKKRKIVVVNKIDLSPKLDRTRIQALLPGVPLVEVSARTGEGLERLKERIQESAGEGVGGAQGGTVIVEMRHRQRLGEARGAIERAKREARSGVWPEIVALEIRTALDRLGEIVGETASEDVLEAIFSRFCVGK